MEKRYYKIGETFKLCEDKTVTITTEIISIIRIEKQ